MNKNILIVASEFPPMPGGIGNHAFCLAKELRKLNYAVTVLTEQREPKPGEWREFLNANTDINILGVCRRRVIVFTYLSRILYVFNLLLLNSYKAVIYSGKFSVWLCGIMPKRQSIIVVHGSEIKQKGLSNYLFEKGLYKANYIVCVSSYTKVQLVSQYKTIDPSKIVVINNGFNNEWSSEKPREKRFDNSKINLVTVGGIHRRKGQFNVVRALPKIIKTFPKAEYRIVGLPVQKDDLLRLINKEKINKYVTFHHGLSNGQVKEILSDSQIFVMLSEHLENGNFEGFGIAVMEAMALGLPAIGAQNSGIADAIRDGYSGKLVDPKSPDDVVNALKEIANNYRQYSVNAKSWAESFQWKYKVAEYERLINEL